VLLLTTFHLERIHMARLANAILKPGTAFDAGHNSPMIDLQNGGQMGYAPDLAGWVSNQAYVRRNLICLLVEAPIGFNYLLNPNYWIGTLRALVELHPLSIDGLNASLTVDKAETPVGGGGQMQEDFTDVKEERSNVVFRWGEKYGMPVASFLRGWITNLMMDPNTKYPNIATLAVKPSDMLADMYSATMIFIEPDPTHTTVMKSWLVTNMWPIGTGEVTGKRDLTTQGDTPTYDVNFSGIAQYSLGVDAFAQQLLDGINITGANPQLRQAFVQSITADILATSASYTAEAAAVGAQAIKV
jgi:hypothetical protein